MDFKVDDKFCIPGSKSTYTIIVYSISQNEFCAQIDLSGRYTSFSAEFLWRNAVKLPTLVDPPQEMTPLSANIAGMIETLNDLYEDANKTSVDVYEKLWSIISNPVLSTEYAPPKSTSDFQSLETRYFIPNGVIKCDHDRVTYDSGWSKYDYCKKCDFKFKDDDK